MVWYQTFANNCNDNNSSLKPMNLGTTSISIEIRNNKNHLICEIMSNIQFLQTVVVLLAVALHQQVLKY